MYVPEIESENVPLIEEALRRGICKPSNCSIVPSKIISNVPLNLLMLSLSALMSCNTSFTESLPLFLPFSSRSTLRSCIPGVRSSGVPKVCFLILGWLKRKIQTSKQSTMFYCWKIARVFLTRTRSEPKKLDFSEQTENPSKKKWLEFYTAPTRVC